MVASGYGIAAQLPYLKKLIYEFNSRKARTRRIHLVWKLGTIELAVAVKDLLDGALMEDTLDDGYGTPDFDAILREEVEGKYIRRVQEKEKRRDDMLVLGKLALQYTLASSNSHSVGIG
ncbi:cell surface metalloreductase [Colletotrichum tofieldiae]|nr:cell surface metalloreductase [Colletotrichum tofieldiae]